MSHRPDKYPLIDPRLPRLYSRILEAAQEMRAAQLASAEIGRIMAVQRMNARAAAAAELADAEPVEKVLD
jgi:hypothetical protein